jgi:23S rRNA (pseudouridine1915-N3)-methyltransferase
MRILIAAIGRLKEAERDLYDRYADRFDAAGRALALGPITLSEMVESRGATTELRKADEAQRLLKAAEGADIRVALDEAGRALSSAELARWIGAERDKGAKTMAFLIGGPDGHGADALASARLKLSLGVMTLPHGIARIVLAEQLYRSATILSGHPYHRA